MTTQCVFLMHKKIPKTLPASKTEIIISMNKPFYFQTVV